MRALHVIGVYPPASMAGPPEQVHRLCRELRTAGVDARVVSTNADGAGKTAAPTDRWVEFEGVPVYYGRRSFGPGFWSWSAWRSMVDASRRSDVVHVTGTLSWINLAMAKAAKRSGVPVVVSPRGSLDPLARNFRTMKKALYFRMGGLRALREATAFHVTSDMEREYVEEFIEGARVVLVPNGVDVPSENELARWTTPPPSAPTVLFLGRLHAKKNLIPLVRAWARITARHPSARLVIAGPDDRGHRVEVERAIVDERVGDSVTLPGRVVGADKHARLARASCLVLPSMTENFGNVVAEALAHRVPVIASTGTPWRGLRDRDCGWWIEPTVESLTSALDEALSIDAAARDAKGRRGRSWMLEEFAWPSVARGMRDLYESVAVRRA